MANVFSGQVYKTGTVTGTCSGATVGSYKAGGTVGMNNVQDGTLAAFLDIAITTGSFTLTPVWQVSEDGSTFVKATGSSNAACTAVSATDTINTAAPDSVYAYPYARVRLLVGGATGAATETYDIRYTYRKRVQPL